MNQPNEVVVYCGGEGVPLAVFSSIEEARTWLRRWQLTGMLYFRYLDVPDYDYAKETGTILPRSLRQDVASGNEPARIREWWHSGVRRCQVVNGVIDDENDFHLQL
jgi:hypothetical protein